MDWIVTWVLTWQMLGYCGDVVFVLAHFLLSTRRLKMGATYQWMQVGAAIMLGTSACMAAFYPTTALELIWICISLASIRQMRREKAMQV